MHPSYFNQALRGHLSNELRRQVEGSCSGRLGYVVAVINEETEDGSWRGRIMEDGQAVFSLKYRAVVYRPFRGEVVDGVVSSVNKVRSHPHSSSSSRARDSETDDGLLPRRWASSLTSARCSASSRPTCVLSSVPSEGISHDSMLTRLLPLRAARPARFQLRPQLEPAVLLELGRYGASSCRSFFG